MGNLMLQFFYALMLIIFTPLLATVPPKQIPEDLKDQYTYQGRIPVQYLYFNEAGSPEHANVYTIDQVNAYLEKALQGKTNHYGITDTYLYAALDAYPEYIQKRDVAIMGSCSPWYEAIIISRGGNTFTIDYNRIISEDPRIHPMTVAEYESNPRLFDALVSISSYEHDGLGRYGDPLDPFGDFKAMQTAKKMLKPGGVLILSVPVGPDTLWWNAHRVYGKIRLPQLLKGWKVLDSYGFTKRDFRKKENAQGWHQPVFVLQPIN